MIITVLLAPDGSVAECCFGHRSGDLVPSRWLYTAAYVKGAVLAPGYRLVHHDLAELLARPAQTDMTVRLENDRWKHKRWDVVDAKLRVQAAEIASLQDRLTNLANDAYHENLSTMARLETRYNLAVVICNDAYHEGWHACRAADDSDLTIAEIDALWAASDARHNLHDDPDAPCPDRRTVEACGKPAQGAACVRAPDHEGPCAACVGA